MLVSQIVMGRDDLKPLSANHSRKRCTVQDPYLLFDLMLQNAGIGNNISKFLYLKLFGVISGSNLKPLRDFTSVLQVRMAGAGLRKSSLPPENSFRTISRIYKPETDEIE